MTRLGTIEAATARVRSIADAPHRFRRLDFVPRRERLDLFSRDDGYAGQLLHQGDQAVVIATFIPANGSGTPQHQHVVEQAFVVVRGAVTLAIEGRDYRVAAGEALVVPRGTMHGTRNNGDEPTLYLEVLAPAPTMFSGLLAKEGAFIDRQPSARPLMSPAGGLAERPAGRDGARRRPLAGVELGCASVAVIHVELPPGAAAAGLRAHAQDRFVYVAQGSLDVVLVGDRYRVPPETLVVLPGEVPHAIGNDSGAPVRLFEIETPPHEGDRGVAVKVAD